jgi:hypothetical protein
MEVINKFPADSVYHSTLDNDVYPVHSRLEIYAWFGSNKHLLHNQSSRTCNFIIPQAECAGLLKHCDKNPGGYSIFRHRSTGRLPAEDVFNISNTLMARVIQGRQGYYDQKFKIRKHADGLHVNYLLNTQTAPFDRNLII